MFYYPTIVDLDALLERLKKEELHFSRHLASLEDQVRKFEDIDLPSYQNRVRLEFGPLFAALEEVQEEIQKHRALIQKVNSILDARNCHPREALFLALQTKTEEVNTNTQKSKQGDWDPDEIEARRRAKLEAKRAERKKERAQNRPQSNFETQRPPKTHSNTNRQDLISLFRSLAKSLHPDSAHSNKTLSQSQALSVWMEVQAAYNAGNRERLLSISAWLYETSGSEKNSISPSASQQIPISLYYSRIHSLRKACFNLERKISQTQNHPAWNFNNRSRTLPRKLRQVARRELEEKLATAQDFLEQLNDFIQSIGTPRRPRV